MPPRWFTAQPSGAIPPLDVPVNQPAVVQTSATIGLRIPERRSDCTGLRPSWFPFAVNVCDWEFDPEDPDLSWRERTTDRPPS